MKVRLSRRAQADIDDIWMHIAELSQNVEAATKVIRDIEDAIDAIGRSPSIGRRRDHDLGAGFRSLPVGLHVIVYRVSRSVRIAGVFHHTRDLPAHFQ